MSNPNEPTDVGRNRTGIGHLAHRQQGDDGGRAAGTPVAPLRACIELTAARRRA